MANNRLEKAETYLLDVIEGKHSGAWPTAVRGFLRSLSLLFRSLVQLRLGLYSHGILRQNMLGCQVVSVGNLTVGGTGKTPIVEIFSRNLQDSGRKVAILSRGYKKKKPPLFKRIANRFTGHDKRHPPLVVSDGERLLHGQAVSGDEPYMLASNLRDVAVIVGKDRVKSGKYAVRELGCDTLILDDGFQYLHLKHRVDIVLVDSTNPFGNRHVLPRGILREPIKNIKRASFIFVTKCEGKADPELIKELKQLNPTAEISECRHCPQHLQNVFTGEILPLTALDGQKVAALSGIARPQGFEDELVKHGSTVIHHKTYADHHRYTEHELIHRINKSIERGANMIVTTEKDAVRFPRINRRDIPIFFLRVEIDLLSGEEDFKECIRRICFK